MLPDDPDASTPEALLTDPATDANPTATEPVRRRGWPFAVAIVLVAVLGGSALFMSGFAVGRDVGKSPGSSISDAQAWQPLWDVYNAVTTRYPLAKLDRTTLIEGAIRGMVEAVGDPYSTYLSPADYVGTLNDISGQFEGIGAEIGAVDDAGNTSDCATFGPSCHMVIVSPIPGSPTEAAGLLAGDIIAMVDGVSLDGLTPDQARDKVRGAAGTSVVLHIQRYSAPVEASGSPAPVASGAPGASPAPRQLLKEFDVTLVRAKIQRRETTARELANGTVGYIQLTGFSDEGANEVKDELTADVGKGITKIVLDLRGNPGGFVTDAEKVASDFIAAGPIMWREDANGVQTETDASGGGVATDSKIQVVVLIDKGSASAAEIVAGALQDRQRAKLIGQTSFGKGTVQEWIELGDLGGVKLTVEKWLTPNKRWIHHLGLTPDVAVTVPTNTPPGSDPVLDKALEVLAGSAAAPAALLLAA
ncbi:MAG: carboxyl-terminal processing protease [Chloroflexota bacterium]|nr:carboxyl-terminal processing protease [Chloroflexota bacterium]